MFEWLYIVSQVSTQIQTRAPNSPPSTLNQAIWIGLSTGLMIGLPYLLSVVLRPYLPGYKRPQEEVHQMLDGLVESMKEVLDCLTEFSKSFDALLRGSFTTKDRERLNRLYETYMNTDQDGIPMGYTPRTIKTDISTLGITSNSNAQLLQTLIERFSRMDKAYQKLSDDMANISSHNKECLTSCQKRIEAISKEVDDVDKALADIFRELRGGGRFSGSGGSP